MRMKKYLLSVVLLVTAMMVSNQLSAQSPTCDQGLIVSIMGSGTGSPLGIPTVTGTTTVCYATANPSVWFTASGGTRPYIFTYSISDGTNTTNHVVTTTAENTSVTVSATTSVAGSFTYTLLNVASAGTGTCTNTSQSPTNIATITVRPQFNPGAIATTGETICTNEDPGIIGNVTLATGGDQNISYQWQSSALGDFSDAVVIPTNSSTYDPGPLSVTTWFRRQAVDGSCNVNYGGDDNTSIGEWKVTVNPRPNVANQTITVCSDEALALTLGNDPTTTATTYNITAINSNNLTASAGSPVVTNTVLNNEIADDAWTNTTNAPVIVEYTVVPISGLNCAGSPFTVTVTVNPEPVMAPALATKTICSDGSTGITLATNGTSVAAATYTINSITVGTGLTPKGGNATTGSGKAASAINGDAWTNETGGSLTVVYSITPVSGADCSGDAFTITVTVDPEPVVLAQTALVCSDVALSGFTLGNDASPVVTSWDITAIAVPVGLTAGAGNTTVTLTTNDQELNGDTWTNTTAGALDVVYTITPKTAAGCSGNPFTVTVTVNPEPVGVATPASQSVCSGVAFGNIVLSTSNSLSGTTFAWTRDNLTNVTGLPASGSGDITGTVTNTTSVTQTVTFTIVPTHEGCVGNSFTASIVVYPSVSATTCVTNDNCQAGSGNIQVNVTKGTAPYTIQMKGTYTSNTNTGASGSAVFTLNTDVDNIRTVTSTTATPTSETFYNLPGNATYNIKITDDKGCVTGTLD